MSFKVSSATVLAMKKADMKAFEAPTALHRIKILAVQAMFSDDELLEQLVLKGGNAMALVHQISARASVDLDFSLKQDFGDDVSRVLKRASSRP